MTKKIKLREATDEQLYKYRRGICLFRNPDRNKTPLKCNGCPAIAKVLCLAETEDVKLDDEIEVDDA